MEATDLKIYSLTQYGEMIENQKDVECLEQK